MEFPSGKKVFCEANDSMFWNSAKGTTANKAQGTIALQAQGTSATIVGAMG